MIVRLLPKSEIDKRKSEEQRMAIQEGLKVAERVDTLREIAATEEVAFEKYRTETLRDIQTEIQSKYDEKDLLVLEVERLRIEKKDLLEPLDAKWKEVNEVFQKNLEFNSSLQDRERGTTKKEEELSQRERNVQVTEGKAEDLKKLASAMFSEAKSLTARAKEESTEMRNLAQAELTLVEIKQKEINKKESVLNVKENNLNTQEKKIEKYEIDLAKREQVLRAGWKQLEKTKQKLTI